MTRLTPYMIKDVPLSSAERDADLIRTLGLTIKGLAYEAVGIDPRQLRMEEFTAAAVPVTSGQGTTEGFSDSVCAIAEHLGMSTFVTDRTDVAGFSDAISAGADIVFMADDEEFVAFNSRTRTFSNNTRSTALGYFTALRVAAGGLKGREVLLIGAGRVGTYAAELLHREQAEVTVVDMDRSKAEALRMAHKNFRVKNDLEAAVMESSLIFNASPARIPGEWICKGAIISSPGMPFSFDEEGLRRAGTLIHDPLQIGVAVMAVWSASRGLPHISVPEGSEIKMEAI
ncbi:MAG: 3-methylornithyl-N6-L-lysine dehydrogenase [Methanomassiliicoccales archaeon PtaU1.Bin030]|nr:MAG: 3-methylornithyl-N6-L-lysine dehydrogenase [Methanomassiliicoccales archaeon PtaU1.Bin030]